MQNDKNAKGHVPKKKRRIYLSIQCKNLDLVQQTYQGIQLGCSYTFQNSFKKLKQEKEAIKESEQNQIRGFDQQVTDKFKNMSSIELS